MKRLLILLMLFALPLHFSWAAAASYCQHESGKATQHFGHHYHEHHAGSADGKDGAGKSPLQVHADCSICHLSCPAAAASVHSLSVIAHGSFVVADPPPPLSSVVLEGPERPKWRFAV